MSTQNRTTLFTTPLNSNYTQAHKKYRLLFFLATITSLISVFAAAYAFSFPQANHLFWMNNSTINHYSTLLANHIGFEKGKSSIFPFIVFLAAEFVLIFSFFQLVNISKAIKKEHNNHKH